MKEDSELIMKDDFSFELNGEHIASYSLTSRMLNIKKGFGAQRHGMVKALAQVELPVSNHVMVDQLDKHEKPVQALKVPKTRADVIPPESSKDDAYVHDEPGAREVNAIGNRADALSNDDLSAREVELARREREVARREAALNMHDAPTRPPLTKVERPLDKEGEPIPAKQFIEKCGPRGAPNLGDKDPYVIEWAKLNLSGDEFWAVYGHRVIPE